jgi:hypothetical protein
LSLIALFSGLASVRHSEAAMHSKYVLRVVHSTPTPRNKEQQQEGYEYIGCARYEDISTTPERVFIGRVTLATCAAACKHSPYFGFQQCEKRCFCMQEDYEHLDQPETCEPQETNSLRGACKEPNSIYIQTNYLDDERDILLQQ